VGKNAKFHTYQLPEDRAHRVVIRHLHPTTPINVIKEALEEEGFSVRNVTNVLHHTTKNKLPLFFVDLEPENKSESIYDLKRLLRCVITVEEPHKKRIIPQCSRCQQYQHTKGYCNHSPKCVKCGEGHLTSVCEKSRDVPAKCALCGGAHPANYKGCQVYSELKRRTAKDMDNSRKPYNQPARSTHPPPSSDSFPALGESQTPPSHQPISPPSAPQQQQATHSQHRPSYSSILAAQPKQVLPAHIPSPVPSLDITAQLNSFLVKLESLISPLITFLKDFAALLPSLSSFKP